MTNIIMTEEQAKQHSNYVSWKARNPNYQRDWYRANKERHKKMNEDRIGYRKANGLCTCCGEPLDTKTKLHCSKCKAMYKANRDQRKAKGICQKCQKPLATNSVLYCDEHLIKSHDYNATVRAYMWRIIHKNAKRRGLSHDDRDTLCDWYVAQPRQCHYCGITEAELLKLGRTDSNGNLSIDRMDNAIGYHVGNLCIACYRCNTLKSNFFTAEEWKEIVERFVKPRINQYHTT